MPTNSSVTWQDDGPFRRVCSLAATARSCATATPTSPDAPRRSFTWNASTAHECSLRSQYAQTSPGCYARWAAIPNASSVAFTAPQQLLNAQSRPPRTVQLSSTHALTCTSDSASWNAPEHATNASQCRSAPFYVLVAYGHAHAAAT